MLKTTGSSDGIGSKSAWSWATYLNAQSSSPTGSSENSTLSGDGVKDDEVNKLTNWIIRELDPTASAVKNDEVDNLSSGVTDETNEILAKSKKHQKIVKDQKICKGLTFGITYLPQFRS